jgi:hypothetical protein
MEKLLNITENSLHKVENRSEKLKNPLSKNGKCTFYNWKIRSVKMENLLSITENPLSKIGKTAE